MDKKAKIEGPAGSIVITTAGVRFIPKEGNGDEVTTDFIKAIKSSSVRAIEKDAKFEYFGYISQDERTVCDFYICWSSLILSASSILEMHFFFSLIRIELFHKNENFFSL